MADQHSPLWPGVPLALGSAVLFGLSAPASKLLIGNVDPWLLAGLLYLGAGVGLATVSMSRRALGLGQVEAPMKKADLPWLLAVILFGGILGPLFLMFGLSLTTASSASLLLNIEGLATMAIAWVVFRENVDFNLLVGAGLIIAGAVFLSWNGNGFALDIGGLWIVMACIAWGIDNNLTRKLSSADPAQIAMVKGLVAGATNIMIALSLGATVPSATFVLAAAGVGFVVIGVSLVMFMLGLRHLGTARTSAYFSIAPFIGSLASFLMFSEPLTTRLIIGGGLMALGVWLHLTEKHAHDHDHEALEHDHVHVHDEHHQHSHDGLATEPHSHLHRHQPMRHKHPHFPDLHHRHGHRH